jgi:ATP-dependent DNA helicase RecQ
VRTDNRQIAKELDDTIHAIVDGIASKVHFMQGSETDPSLAKYYACKRSFAKSNFSFSTYAGRSALIPEHLDHPELYRLLKKKRDDLCSEKGLPVYLVCNSASLEEMATYLPLTLTSLEKISGFGKIKVAQFGKHFVSIITDYCDSNNLVPPDTFVPVKRQRKTPTGKSLKEDTKKITFEKFTHGKSINEIATERNLATTTIEGHLAHFIKEGQISLDSLVKPETINTIRLTRIKAPGETLSGLKLLLPDVSYADIKFYLATENN